MKTTILAALLSTVAVFGGCGTDAPATSATPDGGAPAEVGGASSSSSGGEPLDSGGFVSKDLSLTLGPIAGTAGQERTLCSTQRLGNTTPIHAGSLRTVITGALQQEIVIYKVSDTIESIAPTECPSLRGLYAEGVTALTISQLGDELVRFGAGDGFTLAANQMIRLELHTSLVAAGDVSARVTFSTMDDALFKREVGLVVGTDPDVDLPPASESEVKGTFALPEVMKTAELLALSGRQHRLGTNLEVKLGTETLYTNTDWQHPVLTVLQPSRALAATDKLTLACQFNNPSGAKVGEGASFVEETCSFRAFYAPSGGSRLCFHTDQVGGGIDVCCPGGGALCAP